MIEHIPVLTKEVISFLAPSPDKNFIDATCGFGGHTKLILERNGPSGRVLAIDQDGVAIERARTNLKNFKNRVDFAKTNFNQLGLLVRSWKVAHLDGILFDLGVSTYQLKTPERGFSFLPCGLEADLDMRMAPDTQRLSAKEIINSWSEENLRQILKEYGEEPHASEIARQIVRECRRSPIQKTNDLVMIIKKALPPKYRYSRQKHFATPTFRALRMVVNSELKNLENGLKQAKQILSPGGRLVVISFHSLEDRIVKNFFRDSTDLEILTPKPIVPTAQEIAFNPSARSGKLRAAKKI